MRFGFVPVPTGGTPFIPGQWDLLFNGTWPTTGAGGGLTFQTITPLNSYSALYFQCAWPTNAVCVGVNQSINSGPTFWCTSLSPKNQEVICPVSSRRINMSVFIGFTGAQSGNNVIIWGLTQPSSIPQVRSDGRTYPIGAFTATSFQSTLGTYTLIAAPVSPFRIFIKSYGLYGLGTASGGFNDMYGTVNGNFGPILGGIPSIINNALTVAGDVRGGLLLDQGTSLQFQLGNAGRTSVSYDLIA